MKIRRNFSFLCFAGLLAACKMGPDYTAPEMSVTEIFQSERTDAVADGTIRTEWWQSFHDPILTGIVEATVKGNHDIRIAASNVARARALRTIERAGLFPTIDAVASAERQGISRMGSNNFISESERDVFNASLDATWEIDLWGRVRRGTEAAEAALQASEEMRRGVMLSAIAEATSAYIQVRGAQKQIAITQENISLLGDVEELSQSQFEAGAVSELDVARTRGERQEEEAKLPDLQAEMMTGIYRISVLTGTPPETYVKELAEAKPLPLPEDPVPIGLRSELLKHRPDVRQAERELASSTARIGIAEASLFPQFFLTGSPGLNARHFSDLFSPDAFAYSLASLISWPIFNAGALTAEVNIAEADTQAALATYEKTVLTALEDAEQSLLRYGKSWQRYKQLQASLASREDAFRIARLRYDSGEEDFLSVLDAQRSLNTIRADTVSAETQILLNLTQLYKALGGGWETFEGDAEK